MEYKNIDQMLEMNLDQARALADLAKKKLQQGDSFGAELAKAQALDYLNIYEALLKKKNLTE